LTKRQKINRYHQLKAAKVKEVVRADARVSRRAAAVASPVAHRGARDCSRAAARDRVPPPPHRRYCRFTARAARAGRSSRFLMRSTSARRPYPAPSWRRDRARCRRCSALGIRRLPRARRRRHGAHGVGDRPATPRDGGRRGGSRRFVTMLRTVPPPPGPPRPPQMCDRPVSSGRANDV